jgi:hypothetical protein
MRKNLSIREMKSSDIGTVTAINVSEDQRKRGHWLPKLIILVISFFLLTVLLRHVSLREIKAALSGADALYLGTGILAALGATVFKAIRYGCFFSPKDRWLKLYGAFALIRVLISALPFRSGELASLGMLKKIRLAPSIAETAPVWLLMRVTDLAALSIWFSFALCLSSVHGKFSESIQWAFWLLTALSAVLVVGVMCSPIFIPRLPWGGSSSWFSQRFNAFRAGLERIHSTRHFLLALALAVMIWGALVASTIWAQLAFGTPLDFWTCCLLSVSVHAFSVLPVHAPLAIGTEDAAWSGLMVMSGVGTAQAIAIAIGIRLFTIFVIMTDALIGLSVLLVSQNSRNL